MPVIRHGVTPTTSRDDLSAIDILQTAVKKGIINVEHVADMLEVNRRKELLANHHTWQGENNGYWYTRLNGANGKKKLIRKKEKKDLEDAIIANALKDENIITFQDAFKEWNDRRADLGFIAASTHGVNEDLFKRYLLKLGEQDIKSLTPEAIVKYLEQLAGYENMTAKAFSNVKGLVVGTLKHAKREGYISFSSCDVTDEIVIPEKAFRRIRRSNEEECFSDVEMDMIIDHVTSHRENIRNLAVLLLAVSGMRIGEVVALSWVNVEDGYVNVCATETRYKSEDGKWWFTVRDSAKTTAGERVVPIPRDYQWMWDAIKATTGNTEGFVFVNECGERLNAQSIRAHVRRMCDKLKIPRRSPHKFRKTYCTRLFEEEVRARVIESLMGHVDVSISDHYYYKDRESIEDKIDLVSGIFKNS